LIATIILNISNQNYVMTFKQPWTLT